MRHNSAPSRDISARRKDDFRETGNDQSCSGPGVEGASTLRDVLQDVSILPPGAGTLGRVSRATLASRLASEPETVFQSPVVVDATRRAIELLDRAHRRRDSMPPCCWRSLQ